MSRKINLPPYSQDDPSPGSEQRRRRRVWVFVLTLLLGTALLLTGRDLQTVLITVAGLGLAGAMVARWVTDDGPLPTVAALGQLGLPGRTR